MVIIGDTFTNVENIKEMDEFVDIYGLPLLNKDKINNLNRFMASNVTGSVIKNPPKSP